MAKFRFQRFSLDHESASMKVGTDGILLGAWADVHNKQTILDVGTGSGLIALMLAQRTEANDAKIHAIDIDPKSVRQAATNFSESVWSHRLAVMRMSLDELSRSAALTSKSFDLIVCNPPYFNSGIQSQDPTRRNARHGRQLSRELLFNAAARILAASGVLSLILPFDQLKTAKQEAARHELVFIRQTCVRPLPNRPFKRALLEFGLDPVLPACDELTIEFVHHSYTEEFRRLTGEFYLQFGNP